MKIIFTKHAESKFQIFSSGKVVINKENVLETVKSPDFKDIESDKPKIIVSKELIDKLILRVVYKKERGIITIVTFYPARKGRYEK
ncbi:hypothetical protein HYS91_03590 [Candidatus Daviesbacteria bacterium]|nr:hypothetical protein [Candidatus Daviesbacteria bacterium]